MFLSRGITFALEQGGNALINGITTRQGVPTSCEVRVYQRETGILLSRTLSKPDGKYLLLGSCKGNYVVAIDPENSYNAVIQDRVNT